MYNDRSRLDPEGRYPADGPRMVERNALRVLACVQPTRIERARDVIEIDVGDAETGIVILVTPEALELRLPTVEWTGGAYGPVAASRLWKRVTTARLSDKRLASLIRQATEFRQAEFVKCPHCGRSFPPEHRHGDVCHGCCERDLGIVH